MILIIININTHNLTDYFLMELGIALSFSQARCFAREVVPKPCSASRAS